MKRWHLAVLVALALPVVGCAGLYGWGITLPATHEVRVEATHAASPAALWEVITDVSEYPSWRTGVDAVKVVEGGERWQEVDDDGETLEYQVVESAWGERWVVAVDDGDFEGTWTWELEPEGQSTFLAITERGAVHSPWMRVGAVLVYDVGAAAWRTHADIDGYLERLRASRTKAPADVVE